MEFLHGFVKQDDDIASILSPEALAALKDLAKARGIDEADGAGDEVDVSALMSNVRGHFEMEKVGSKEEVTEYTFGDVSLSVRGVKQELGKTLDSTGLTIWRAAENLCAWMVENKDYFEKKKVCELGAGLGLVSILLAKLSIAKVPIICTDGDEISINLLEDNLERNDCEFKVDAKKLFWGKGHDEFLQKYPNIDLIVAADVVYEDYHLEALLSTVLAVFKSREEDKAPVKFILSYARRHVPLETIIDAFASNGLQSEIVSGDVEPILIISSKEE